MLRALDDPSSLLVLVVAYVVAVTLGGWVSALVAARLGDRQVRLEQRTRPDPRRQVDPYAAVGAALTGLGWVRAAPPGRRSTGRTAAVLLSGPLVVLAVGVGALAGYAAVHGLVPVSSALLQLGARGLPLGEKAWLLSGLVATYVGALSLVPLPPLPGGLLLFAAAPRSPGWQKAELQLVERNIGTAVLLGLLLLGILPELLDTVLEPLVHLLPGAG